MQFGDQRELDHKSGHRAQGAGRRWLSWRLHDCWPWARARAVCKTTICPPAPRALCRPITNRVPLPRRREVKPLPEVDAEVEADAELLLGLDGLGDRASTERVGAARD